VGSAEEDAGNGRVRIAFQILIVVSLVGVGFTVRVLDQPGQSH
jgi:hypothetical protein